MLNLSFDTVQHHKLLKLSLEVSQSIFKKKKIKNLVRQMISEQLIQPRRTVLLFGGLKKKTGKKSNFSQILLQMSYKRLELKSLKAECLQTSSTRSAPLSCPCVKAAPLRSCRRYSFKNTSCPVAPAQEFPFNLSLWRKKEPRSWTRRRVPRYYFTRVILVFCGWECGDALRQWPRWVGLPADQSRCAPLCSPSLRGCHTRAELWIQICSICSQEHAD